MAETFAVRVLGALDTGDVAARLHDGVQLLPEHQDADSHTARTDLGRAPDLAIV